MGAAAAPALDVWGIEGAERWDQAGLMRYRSRRDLMEIASNPAFQGPHEFKIAAMNKTVAFPIHAREYRRQRGSSHCGRRIKNRAGDASTRLP
jgi:hypothetical protein